jgi:hypothetical protein
MESPRRLAHEVHKGIRPVSLDPSKGVRKQARAFAAYRKLTQVIRAHDTRARTRVLA